MLGRRYAQLLNLLGDGDVDQAAMQAFVDLVVGVGEQPDQAVTGKERRQQREIAEARRLLDQFKERRRRERPKTGSGRG